MKLSKEYLVISNPTTFALAHVILAALSAHSFFTSSHFKISANNASIGIWLVCLDILNGYSNYFHSFKVHRKRAHNQCGRSDPLGSRLGQIVHI